MKNLLKTLANEIALSLNGNTSPIEIEKLFEKPKHNHQGDIAFPCFLLAKQLKVSPMSIAKDLSAKIRHPLFEKIVADGPYLNCFFNKLAVSKMIFSEILTNQSGYGSHSFGQGQKIVIDYSSPNIAKPFSMGHLRSTVIGHSLANIVEKCGFKAVRINHLGDWGTQFGKLIVAYKMWGKDEKIKENPIKELLNLYVKFHLEAENNDVLEDDARFWFKKLEDGDPEAAQLWQWFRDESLKEFAKIYQLLNIHFDSYQGEAFYNNKMEKTIEILRKENLLKKSIGAEVVELEEYDLPPC